MLVEFRVKNFKRFKEELVFKLDRIKKYEYSLEAIRNNVIKTSVIYGRNASGKTTIGDAIFDICKNLNDKESIFRESNGTFVNLFTGGEVSFYYKFKFDLYDLVYKYKKDEQQNIINEEVLINNNSKIVYNHLKHEGVVNLKGAETLKVSLSGNKISFLKYIKNNSILYNNKENKILYMFFEFVDNMKLCSYCKAKSFVEKSSVSISRIIDQGKVFEFEEFLSSLGINYRLVVREFDGKKNIFCLFDKMEINFNKIASRGTMFLTEVFSFLIEMNKITFLFIDAESSIYYKNYEAIIKKILKCNSQSIITTHNTSIMSSNILRPDCIFYISDGKIESLAYRTKKDLRRNHNIECIYNANLFDS